MSDHGAKTPAIDSGYEDKQSSNESYGHDESQPVSITYRVYINRVPASMNESEVYDIVASMVDVKPNFFKMCWQMMHSRYRSADDAPNEKYCIVEYDQESTGRALVEALNRKPPHNFQLNFRVHERFSGGAYKSQQYHNSHQRGGHQQRHGQQNSAGNYPRFNNSLYNNKRGNYNHHYNNNNSIPRMHGKTSSFRGPNPSYMKSNDELTSYMPMYSSPPNGNVVQFQPEFSRPPMAMPGPHPHLMLLGGVQHCYGCGAMTQSNCITCYTPFCSGFCLSKLTNPSHPNECHSMFVTSPHQAVGNQPNFVWMQQQQWQQQQPDDIPKPNKKRNKAKQVAQQQNGQAVDKSEIALIEAGVKDLNLMDKPPTAGPVSNLPPQNVNTPAAYVPLTPTSTPNSTPPMPLTETKQFKKEASPPRVEINKSPDNNAVKQNSTGSSPHTITTPPVGQNVEPFNVTPHHQMAPKMMVPPSGGMMMMHPQMPMGPMMPGPGGPTAPMWVLLPNQQMVMAHPYYGAGGDFMPPPVANFGEQPHIDFTQQPPAYDYAQNQPMALHPQVPPQVVPQMPQPFFYPNFQAY